MSEFCIICGEPLVEGKCPNAATHFKSMCLNCKDCKLSEDGTYRCFNEENKANALEKLKAVGDIGYTIKLEPLPLKNPTKKCKVWSMNEELVLSNLISE